MITPLIPNSNHSMDKYILLLALLATAAAQSQIELDKIIKVSLKANSPAIYTAIIPNLNRTELQEDLYILADPIVANPSQIPSITATISESTAIQCFKDSNQLQGICILNTTLISSQLSLSLSCLEDCTFFLRMYLSDVYQLELNHHYKISQNFSNMAIYQFSLATPKEQFDELSILLHFKQLQMKQKGAQMYANVGNAGALQPNEQSNQYKAVPIQNGLVMDLSKQDLPVGTWIKLSIYSEFKGMMMLSATISLGNSYTLPIGQSIYAVVPNSKNNMFNITLAEHVDLEQHNINIEIILYSGHPEIDASFYPSFNHSLANYGVGGNLNYLITPEIRQTYNFQNIVYLKVQAFNEQVSFKLTSSIISSAYIYMEEALSYVTALQNKDVQNYIYDYTYQAPKNADSNLTLHFTVKVEMLKGGLYYFSRICRKVSNLQCAVDVKGLTDPQFLKEVDQLPGDILHYYSVYQIYQWVKLSQCNSTELNNNTDLYQCKIHIVGYNPRDSQCQWVMTMFSRQQNIEIRAGRPFKDKVYQDSYNFYYFRPPNTPFEEVQIFLTLLTGSTEIIGSLKYQKPEFVLMKWDSSMKIGMHSITYTKKQLTGQLYIAVYGDTMAEYMIHVSIVKNQTQSIITLLPQIGQLFRLEEGQTEQAFKLIPNTKDNWFVEVKPLNNKVKFEVSYLLNNSGINLCPSSACVIATEKGAQFLLKVGKISSDQKEIRFVVSYYPKDRCRILPLGTPSLISLSVNGSSCVEYILDGRQILLAYSRNILSSLTSSLTFKVIVNGKFLGNMQDHYKLLSADTIEGLCFNGSTRAERCVLRVDIKGSQTQLIDLWLTAALNRDAIPLFSGVVLPFRRGKVTSKIPMRFYYEHSDNSKVTLLIQSETYDEYFIEWLQVDETAFLTADNDDAIYPTLDKGSGQTYHITRYHRSVSMSIQPINCTICILLISIFPKEDISQSYFQLQIVGDSVSLGLGETRKVILNREESIVFNLASNQKETLVSMNAQPMNCYRATIINSVNPDNQIKVEAKELILANYTSYELEVVGTTENCRLEVSRWSSDSPIRSMKGGATYHVSISQGHSLYFLYFHELNSTFRIYEVITSGSLYSYATPLHNITLHEVLKSQHFLFGSDSPYEDLQVEVNSSGFCYDCYYLIKLVGAPSSELQVGVSDPLTPVVLPESGVVRQKMGSRSFRIYQYQSYSSYKLQLTLVHGSLTVTVKDDQQKTLYSRLLSTDTSIEISNLNNELIVGKIVLESQEAVVYALQVLSLGGARLIEGMPYSQRFKAKEPVQFLYSHSTEEQINLIVIAENNNSAKVPSISLNVTEFSSDNRSETNVPIFPSYSTGNIIFFSFSGKPRHYRLLLTVDESLPCKLLITRNNLTYLPENTQILAFQPSIFEINTKGLNVMLQAFACKGTIELMASSKYSNFESNKSAQEMQTSSQVIVLEHNNIAGHYVINSQSTLSQFYAKVSGQMYRISYHYIKTQIPYKMFTTVSDNMIYQITSDQIKVYIELPLPKNNLQAHLSNLQAEYKLIYGRTQQDVITYSQCLIGGAAMVVTSSVDKYPSVSSPFMISIDRSHLNEQFSQNLKQIFIGLQLVIRFEEQSLINGLTYVYYPLQVVFTQEKEGVNFAEYSWLTDILILIFVALIVLVVLRISLAFCWRYWKLFRQHNGYVLEDEDQTQNPSIQGIQKNKQQSVSNA